MPEIANLISNAVASPGGRGTICENVLAHCQASPRLCADNEGLWRLAFESAFGLTIVGDRDEPRPWWEKWSKAFVDVCSALDLEKDASAGVLDREWKDLPSWTPADVDAKLCYCEKKWKMNWETPLLLMLRARGGDGERHRDRVAVSRLLIDAVKKRDIDEVRSKLRELLSPELVTTLVCDGTTALSTASAFADESIIQLLLDNGAGGRGLYGARMIDHGSARKRWDTHDAEKATPLISASARGDEGIVRALLEGKADVNLKVPQSKDRYWTALLQAAQSNNAGMMDQLLTAGGDMEVRAPHGNVRAIALSHPWYAAEMRKVLEKHVGPGARAGLWE